MALRIKPAMRLACFLFLANIAHGTVFTASGNLQCYSNGLWCFYISYWEIDSLFKDDRLDFIGVQCSRGRYFPYHLKGEEDGDGLFNDYYELEIYVRHNCTGNGQLRMVTNTLPPKSVAIPTVNVEWDVDLTNNGEEISTFFFGSRNY